MFTEDIVSACKNVSAFMEDRVSVCIDIYACKDVSDENMGLHRRKCLYISTKGTGMRVVTPTDESKVKTFVRSRTDAYDEYGRYEPIQDIGPDILGKVQKGIRYADALQHGSLGLMKP